MSGTDEFGPPIYFAELLYETFRRWRLIFASIVFCALAGVVYILASSDLYTARALIVPVSERSTSSQVGDALGLFPFAKMSGLIGSGARATEANIALEIISTRSFFEKLLGKHSRFRELMLPNCADGQDTDNCASREIWSAWNRWQKSILKTGTKEETGVIWVEITLPDPRVAAEVANILIAEVDRQIRAQKLEQTAANIAYLSNQLASVSQTEVRVTIADLLKHQIEQHMLASNDSAYVFRVLEMAVPPVFRSSPRPLLAVLAAIFIGLLLGTFLAFTQACRATIGTHEIGR